jgi:hydrogenase expression/formation protein HypC
MCLGVPGKVIRMVEEPLGLPMGKVSFGGIIKDICLAYVPDVQVGDYVVVHVGFAISKIDEHEAREVFAFLQQMAALAALDAPPPEESADGSNTMEGERRCAS